VHESRSDFLRRPYHTASYSEANTRGVLATLPQETYDAILEVYDIIFAFHQGRITDQSVADEVLSEKLPELANILKNTLKVKN